MAKTKIGSNAIFTGVGPSSFTTIGNRCYAYSGYKKFSNSETTVLDFYTPNGYILSTWQYSIMDDSETINEDDSNIKIKFNGSRVFVQVDSGSPNRVQNAWPDLIIPPLTRVEVTVQNVTDASNLAAFVAMVGRVYA